ncbi:MAG: hypothetical protein KDF54_00065 [Hydrogenophaga sp.]|nr:hypothetical protein [Hydrogenophaga sp.]
MSYLQQLKRQAQTLQSEKGESEQGLDIRFRATELACQQVWNYFGELARQLNVIEPPAHHLGLDKRAPWTGMCQRSFRFDARKKRLRDREAFDYLALGWELVPRDGQVRKGRTLVNFPPDLERVEKRLAAGHVPHERLEQRHPETNALQAFVFEFDLTARASVLVTADHDEGCLQFRLACVGGMEVVQKRVAAEEVDGGLLDELARLIVGDANHFL